MFIDDRNDIYDKDKITTNPDFRNKLWIEHKTEMPHSGGIATFYDRELTDAGWHYLRESLSHQRDALTNLFYSRAI